MFFKATFKKFFFGEKRWEFNTFPDERKSK